MEISEKQMTQFSPLENAQFQLPDFPIEIKGIKPRLTNGSLRWRVKDCFLHWCQSKKGRFPLIDTLVTFCRSL